jgi:hypothetical protein
MDLTGVGDCLRSESMMRAGVVCGSPLSIVVGLRFFVREFNDYPLLVLYMFEYVRDFLYTESLASGSG